MGDTFNGQTEGENQVLMSHRPDGPSGARWITATLSLLLLAACYAGPLIIQVQDGDGAPLKGVYVKVMESGDTPSKENVCGRQTDDKGEAVCSALSGKRFRKNREYAVEVNVLGFKPLNTDFVYEEGLQDRLTLSVEDQLVVKSDGSPEISRKTKRDAVPTVVVP